MEKYIGCGCKKSNCYTSLDFDQLECLALGTRKLQKITFAVRNWTAVSVNAHNCQHWQKAGIFLSSPYPEEPVCKSIFLEINGIGDHVYQELKTIAELCNPEVPIHRLAGKLHLTQKTVARWQWNSATILTVSMKAVLDHVNTIFSTSGVKCVFIMESSEKKLYLAVFLFIPYCTYETIRTTF